jgi:uncharacterized protein (TIGR03382 family)
MAGFAANPEGLRQDFVVYLDPDGDYNANAIVDQGDLDQALLNWGQPAASVPAGWINFRSSGAVDQAALDEVLLNWGKTGPLYNAPPLVFAVPEPASVQLCLLLLVGTAWLLVRRRPTRVGT